jgi:hypothetical protein
VNRQIPLRFSSFRPPLPRCRGGQNENKLFIWPVLHHLFPIWDSYPALLTRTSIRPKASMAKTTTLSASIVEVKSSFTGRICEP